MAVYPAFLGAAMGICKRACPSYVNRKCFLCGVKAVKKERVMVFGKSTENISQLIDSVFNLNVDVSYPSRNSFICSKSCYKRLIRYKKAKISLETIQEENYVCLVDSNSTNPRRINITWQHWTPLLVFIHDSGVPYTTEYNPSSRASASSSDIFDKRVAGYTKLLKFGDLIFHKT